MGVIVTFYRGESIPGVKVGHTLVPSIVADRCCEPVVNRPGVVWSAASSKSCEGMSEGFVQLANECLKFRSLLTTNKRN